MGRPPSEASAQAGRRGEHARRGKEQASGRKRANRPEAGKEERNSFFPFLIFPKQFQNEISTQFES